MANHLIVVDDPSHEINDGTVMQDGPGVDRLVRQGVVVLPYDGERQVGAAAGYFKRAWGKGWLYNRNAGERGCPMVIDIDPALPYVYWAVRLRQVGHALPSGQFKLTTDSSGQRANSGGLAAEVRVSRLDSLGEPDARGGWTVAGRSYLTTSFGGFMALCVYGVAQDALVMWSAVTQARQKQSLPWFEQAGP